MTNRAPPRTKVSTRLPSKETMTDWAHRTVHPTILGTQDIVEAIVQNRVVDISTSGTTTISPDEDLALVDATSGNVTIGFPTAALWEKRITIVKTDATSNTVTVPSTPPVVLNTQYQAVEVVCDGTTYYAVSGVITLSGDVTGLSSANTVSKLQGTLLSASGGHAPTTGQVLMYDGTQWLPVSRNIVALDNTYSPVANWSFNIAPATTVSDLSGNGCTLSTETGTLRTTSLHPTFGGVYFDGAFNLRNVTPQPQLQLLGAMTTIVMGMWADLPASLYTWYSYGTAGETEDTNVLYMGQYDSSAQFQYFSEHGAGVNDTANTLSTAGRYQPFLMCITRSAGGVLFHGLNGTFAGSSFGTVTLPTGGTNSIIRVGADNGGGNFLKAILGQLLIYNFEMSAAQFKERYNASLGGAFGLK